MFQEPQLPRVSSMDPVGQGFFTRLESSVPEGTRYAFQLDGGPPRPDPTSRWQPFGVHQPSAVVNTGDFRWCDSDWKGVPRDELVIYELHVGTFTAAGNFDSIVPRLKSLRELGVTAIELMPIAQFAGSRNWGYDGAYLFAVHDSYGGPWGLQRLVNACHREKLAVILDVVYNHLGPEGNYLAEFGPYFTDRYCTPWGGAVNYDGPGADAVRAFVLDNVRYWIRDFHVDGLRLDAVHAIHDESPKHILQEIKEVADQEAKSRGRPVHIIAESNQNDVRALDPNERRGHGLDALWNDDFHHCVHTLLTEESDGYYIDFGGAHQLAKVVCRTFAYDGCYSHFHGRRHGAPAGDHPGDRFVVAIQTHDQVGNRARGERLAALIPPARLRLGASVFLLSPFLPLLFMGEEYGEQHPFPFFCDFSDTALIEAVRRGRREEFATFNWHAVVPDPQSQATYEAAVLTWEWKSTAWQSALRRLYADLLALRSSVPALRDFANREANVLDAEDLPRVVRFIRGKTRESQQWVEAYFNFSSSIAPLPESHRRFSEVLLSSEASLYGGTRTAKDEPCDLLPYEALVLCRTTQDVINDCSNET